MERDFIYPSDHFWIEHFFYFKTQNIFIYFSFNLLMWPLGIRKLVQTELGQVCRSKRTYFSFGQGDFFLDEVMIYNMGLSERINRGLSKYVLYTYGLFLKLSFILTTGLRETLLLVWFSFRKGSIRLGFCT